MLAAAIAVAFAVAVALATPPSAAVAAPQAQRDYVKLVDPWVESDRGRFFFFQSASQPFGFVKLRPDTSTNAPWQSGYYHDQHEVKGFSHLHDWQLSGVQVMPTSGESVPKTEGDTGWQSYTKHDDSEVVEPGYHKLHLDRYGITAELTSTKRVGMHRYTYDKAGPSEIIVNLGGVLGEAHMKNAHVTRVGRHELEGYVVEGGELTDGLYWPQTPPEKTKLYFDIRFDKGFDSMHGWSKDALLNGGRPVDEASGDDMGVYVRYDHLDAGDVVQMKVALSLTSTQGAQRNLDAELPGWDFDAVKRAAQDEWNQMLGRIDVGGGTHQQQVKFYTDLFHALCGRSTVSDVDGRYLDNTWGRDRVGQIPLDAQGNPKFAMYNYDAIWLTQWNLNTLLGMAYPEVYSSFVHSQLQMYKDGGLLPRGPVAGNYSLVMTSSPVTNFITGAWNKGIRDFDINLAYKAMLDAQSMGGLFDKAPYEYATWGNNGGAMRQYLDKGYVPYDLSNGWQSRGAGETAEYSFQDWTLAQLARELHKQGLNASQFAHVSVSSQLDDGRFAGERAVDGRPIRSGITPGDNVEWASKGEAHPWIRLSWDQERRIDKVVLSDRADQSSNVNSGTLTFSDGSTVDVHGIQHDGTDKVVTFPWKTVKWVKFEATGGTGTNVGLNEIEAWDDTDAAAYLQQRSRSWRNLFDRSTGFMRPRGSDGRWLKPFDPLSNVDFVEANSWQTSWFEVHDVMGLANLLGGTKAYADKLDSAFQRSADAGFIGEGQNGDSDAFVNYGNQPGLELAHLFNYVGYPWLSQYWVRQVKDKVYSSTSTTDGYGHHDEDEGQMGSLSALMAMGLFEVTGGSLSQPVYDITSPIFDDVTIKLNPRYYSGGQFRIVTHDNSAANMYIQRATLDGKELDNSWFRHDQLTRGGTLELWMGDQPNKDWGTKNLPPSESKPASAVPFATPDYVRVDSGQSAVVQLGAKNLTDKAVDIHWSASAQGGLQVEPPSGGLSVPAGQTASQGVTVRVPEGTPDGAYRVQISARDGEGNQLPEAIAYVHVAPALEVSTAPTDLRLLQGTPVSFQVRLDNNDGDVAHTTTARVEAPAGWTVEPSTRSVEVPAGGSTTTTFAVTPPADATGRHTLTVVTDGDWGSTSQEVQATVSRPVALVGKADLSTAELALSPNHYGDYTTRFPNGVDLTVGTDDPATAWSYIQPGPADAWAGSRSHTFTLRFDLPAAPQHDLALTGWLLDTHNAGPPRLALTLNGGAPGTVDLPQGGGDGYHWGDGGPNYWGGIRPSSFDYMLPASQLKAGRNVVTITTTNGSWMVWDAVGIRDPA